MSQDSRNYYDEQFGGRINDIAKPGATPPRSNSTGSSGSWGMRGVGGVIGVVVLIVIRVALFSARSSSYSPPTYQYTPPPTYTLPQQRFDFDPNDQFPQKDGNNWDEPKEKDLRKQMADDAFKDK
jgi:hypothetical protein